MFLSFWPRVVLCTILSAAFTVNAESSLTESQAISLALDANPNIKAYESRAHALAQIPAQRRTLPDTQLSANLLNVPVESFSLSEEAMTQVQFGIKQRLPFPGKLALRQEVAAKEAEAAAAQVEEMRLHIVRDVRVIWWNVFYIDQALSITGKTKTLLEQLITIAETQYQVGQGSQQNVLVAQLKLLDLRNQVILLEQQRETEAAKLNVLMNRQANKTVVLAPVEYSQVPAIASEEELFSRAQRTRPVLTAMRKKVEAADSSSRLAKKEASPDFTLGAAYGIRSGITPNGDDRSDLASLMFSIDLPIFSRKRYAREVDQREAERLQRKYAYQDRLRQINGEIQRAVIHYKSAESQNRLYGNEILPQARQTVDSLMAGYQVGKVDFLNLVQAQISLNEYEKRFWEFYSAAMQAMATISAAIGEKVTQ